MKSMTKRMTAFVTFFAMMVGFLLIGSSTSWVQAMTEEPDVMGNVSINVICKYLYLGEEGKDTFDFDISENAALEGATYHWYIKANKGNPDSITINSKTGAVTAKKAGIAYIRCKITLTDNTVLRPEAKVVVINRITEVAISNISQNLKIEAGKSTDFKCTVLNTKAGRSAATNAITRWEITDDTAGVGSASDQGFVLPTKTGEFSIRAVCFADQDDYRLWTNNKEKYNDRITAASEWARIQVITHEGKAATLDQLSELLTAEDITTITIATQEKLDIILYSGNYPDKTLIVDAPNVSIENHAYFKNIILKPANYALWLECVSGNTLTIMEKSVLLYAMDTAVIENIQVNTAKDQKTSEYSNSAYNRNKAMIKSFVTTLGENGTVVELFTGTDPQKSTASTSTVTSSSDTGRAVVIANLPSASDSAANLSGINAPVVGPAPITRFGNNPALINDGSDSVITGGTSNNAYLIKSRGASKDSATETKGGFYGNIQRTVILSDEGATGKGIISTGSGAYSGYITVTPGSLAFYSDKSELPLVINSRSSITLSGTTAGSYAIDLTNNAEGSTISSSVPVKVMASAAVSYNLEPGSKGSIIVFNPTGAGSQVSNDSGQDITLAFTGNGGTSENSIVTVQSGKTADVKATSATVSQTNKTP